MRRKPKLELPPKAAPVESLPSTPSVLVPEVSEDDVSLRILDSIIKRGDHHSTKASNKMPVGAPTIHSNKNVVSLGSSIPNSLHSLVSYGSSEEDEDNEVGTTTLEEGKNGKETPSGTNSSTMAASLTPSVVPVVTVMSQEENDKTDGHRPSEEGIIIDTSIDGVGKSVEDVDPFKAWSPMYDKESGSIYYYNVSTGETSWERKCHPREVWMPLYDHTSGRIYFGNTETGETSWERRSCLGSMNEDVGVGVALETQGGETLDGKKKRKRVEGGDDDDHEEEENMSSTKRARVDRKEREEGEVEEEIDGEGAGSAIQDPSSSLQNISSSSPTEAMADTVSQDAGGLHTHELPAGLTSAKDPSVSFDGDVTGLSKIEALSLKLKHAVMSLQTPFQTRLRKLLLSLEVRVDDWREGGLSEEFMMMRLRGMIDSLDHLDLLTRMVPTTIIVCDKSGSTRKLSPESIVDALGIYDTRLAVRDVGLGYYTISFPPPSTETDEDPVDHYDHTPFTSVKTWKVSQYDSNVYYRSFEKKDGYSLFSDEPRWIIRRNSSSGEDGGVRGGSGMIVMNSDRLEMLERNRVLVEGAAGGGGGAKVKIKSRKLNALISKWESLTASEGKKEVKEKSEGPSWYAHQVKTGEVYTNPNLQPVGVRKVIFLGVEDGETKKKEEEEEDAIDDGASKIDPGNGGGSGSIAAAPPAALASWREKALKHKQLKAQHLI